MLPATKRSRDGVFHRPAAPNAEVNCARRQTVFVAQFKERIRLSVKLKSGVVAFVVSLLMFGGPFAIVRSVRTVIANPFDSVLHGRRCTHVGCEVGERITPSLADRYASAAVVREVFGAVIVTASNHIAPRAVYVSSGQSVRCGGYRGALDMVAPTTCRVSALKVATSNDDRFAAITSTRPSNRVASSVRRTRQDSQPSETLSGQVCESHSCIVTGLTREV